MEFKCCLNATRDSCLAGCYLDCCPLSDLSYCSQSSLDALPRIDALPRTDSCTRPDSYTCPDALPRTDSYTCPANCRRETASVVGVAV